MAAPEVLPAVEQALIAHFGHEPARASVSFVGVDPIEILRFEPIPGERAYLTLGMARHPMISAAETLVAATGPRAELMLHVSDPTDAYAQLWRRLAVLGAAPAVEGVVYSVGMSVDLGEPLVPGSLCTGVLLDRSRLEPVRLDDDGRCGDGNEAEVTVDVLQVLPATQAELAWCRVRGSNELRTRWADQGVDLLDLRRRGAALEP